MSITYLANFFNCCMIIMEVFIQEVNYASFCGSTGGFCYKTGVYG